METRLAQVMDRLVELARALPGHRGPTDYTTADDLITVYDGPEIRATDDRAPGGHLVIGWPGDSADTVTAAGSTSVEAGPIASTARPRDEVGTIICRAIQDQAGTAKDARDGALAQIASVAALCRSDPSLGLNTSDTIGGVRTITFVTAGDLYQYLSGGYTCEWEFSITYKTRV